MLDGSQPKMSRRFQTWLQGLLGNALRHGAFQVVTSRPVGTCCSRKVGAAVHFVRGRIVSFSSIEHTSIVSRAEQRGGCRHGFPQQREL